MSFTHNMTIRRPLEIVLERCINVVSQAARKQNDPTKHKL